MRLHAYLHFDGTCAEAFRFYAEALGGEPQGTMTYGQSPMAEQMPPEMHGLVMHTALKLGEDVLMGSDAPPHMRTPFGGVTLTLNSETVDEAERLFAALSEGGTVEVAMAETFWAERWGMCRDRFGVSWMVNGSMKM
jgi:PhnB protein